MLPGTVLGHANAALASHGRRLGPDPASTDIATVGGVIANNSGGMRCGVVHDSYQTVRSLTFVLPSGTTIDTAQAGAEHEFAEREPELAHGLAQIRDEIRADSRAGRADQAKVRDQEHDRLPARRVPGRRRAAGDLQAAAGRVGGHARVRLRGGVRDRAVRAARDDGVRDLPDDRRCGRVRAAAGRGGRERHRADDGALDEGGAGVRRDPARVERGSGRRGRDPGGVSLRRRDRAGAARGATRWSCSPVARWSSRRGSRATPS